MGVERRRVDAVWSLNVSAPDGSSKRPTDVDRERKDAHGRVVAVAQPLVAPVSTISRLSAAKHAVVDSSGHAMDLAPTGDRDAVSPGSTRTALLDASAQVYELSMPRSSRATAHRRLIEPVEIAAAISWLCRRASASGADVAVDGA